MSENHVYRVQGGDHLWSIYVGDSKRGDAEFQARANQWDDAKNEAAAAGRDPDVINPFNEQTGEGDYITFSDEEFANLPEETQAAIREQGGYNALAENPEGNGDNPEDNGDNPQGNEDEPAGNGDNPEGNGDNPEGDGQSSDATTAQHVNTLLQHWDSLRGNDDIVSKEDLQAIADGDAPDGEDRQARGQTSSDWDRFKEQNGGADYRAVQDAAEYFLGEEGSEAFEQIDGLNGSEPDTKISDDELNEWATAHAAGNAPAETAPDEDMTEDEIAEMHARVLFSPDEENGGRVWDMINGDDNITSLEDLEAINNGNPPDGVDADDWARFKLEEDGAPYNRVLAAAQYFIHNPERLDAIDRLNGSGEDDKISTEEMEEFFSDSDA